MRLLVIIVALGMLPQIASAQMSECKAIADAGTRLACYDRIAASPAPTATAKQALRAAPPSKPDNSTGYVDSIGSEDALMNARLRNICRGC